MGELAFSTFRSQVRAVAFPEGESDNLVANHNKYILDGLIDLQQKIECFRCNHEEKVPQCASYYNCGASVFEAPRGYIYDLYTISSLDDCCNKVFYTPTGKDQIDCLISEAEACGSIVHPYGYYFTGAYYWPYLDLPYVCMEFPSADTDLSCRPKEGKFAMFRGQLWMFPALQSHETAVIVWDGIKREWADGEMISDDREIMQATELYLAMWVALKEDCDRDRYVGLKLEYERKRAELIWQCKKEHILRVKEPCFVNI